MRAENRLTSIVRIQSAELAATIAIAATVHPS